MDNDEGNQSQTERNREVSGGGAANWGVMRSRQMLHVNQRDQSDQVVDQNEEKQRQQERKPPLGAPLPKHRFNHFISQPTDHGLHKLRQAALVTKRSFPCEAGPVLVGGQFVSSGGGPLHEVGHAHAVVGKGMSRFAVDGGDTGVERGRPETVAGASEPHERLSGVHAGVQPTDEQAHSRADDVG